MKTAVTKQNSSNLHLIQGGNLKIEYDNALNSRVIANFGSHDTMIGDFTPSEYVTISGEDIADFNFIGHEEKKIKDSIGTGSEFVIIGSSSELNKKVTVKIYDEFLSMALFQVTYTNISSSPLKINSWTNNQYAINVGAKKENKPDFWSYQSGSYETRPDWVLPVKEGFNQENYMGMNASDYGGGTPISDVWHRDIGIAVGHVESVPKQVSLPVSMRNSNNAILCIKFIMNAQLNPGESFSTFETFVSVHIGDYFNTLAEYSKLMSKKGVEFTEPPLTSYEQVWCAWGYERDFKMEQIYGALPEVKKLGYKWVCLDDGWQTALGDWYLDKTKFPNGDADMKKLVDKIHSEGFKAQLWWVPLAVHPETDLEREHPEYLLINEQGKPQLISWWDSHYLCPANSEVWEQTKKMLEKIFINWGFDGIKLDGQHLNGAPPCYNKSHAHTRAEESVEAMPEFFKKIYETIMNIKKEAVVMFCPCGTAYSFFTLPYMNQSVAADPGSSWQVRTKGKTLRALTGSNVAFCGDHIELSDNGDDFASTVGIGGVVVTKFTWPVDSFPNPKVALDKDKEIIWAMWSKIYEEKMLPLGTYIGELYDIGFDYPEAHVIKKDSNIYYSFYADTWDGEIELRGMEDRCYIVYDYVNQKDYGKVRGSAAKLNTKFTRFLLLEAKPV